MRFGLPAESSAAESSAAGSGETAQAETQTSETPVGEAKTTEDLQPLMLGDAGESDIYDTTAGTPAENILQRESNIQLSVLMGARQRRNTMQLAAELEQSRAMLSEASDNYDQYEGVIRSGVRASAPMRCPSSAAAMSGAVRTPTPVWIARALRATS